MNIFDKLAADGRTPVHILHGTDWWTDCDDIVALRLLCRAHKSGIIKLECVCADAVMEHTAASIDAFILSEGLEDIPIGVDRNAYSTGERCRYQSVLAKYPHRISGNEACEDACRLYRRVLSRLDSKADITEIGFPQIIHQLLISPPDDISPLDGMSLVKQKVNKIWMMAGKWDTPDGREYNLINTPASRAAGHFICENSPVPLSFLGFEVGESVITGGGEPDGDLLRVGMAAHGSQNGRSSWDPMLALMAIINDEQAAGYRTVRGTARVNPETGENNFTESPDGKHTYVVKAHSDEFYSEMINSLIK
ncbi:MAG: hypothetical protein GX051_09255 [Clostridiales bacterium]|nr:hypothetical protein [Clostridiales bacterium]